MNMLQLIVSFCLLAVKFSFAQQPMYAGYPQYPAPVQQPTYAGYPQYPASVQQPTYGGYPQYPVSAQQPTYANPTEPTFKADPVTEYQLKYHRLPPASPPTPAQIAAAKTIEVPTETTITEAEETPEQKEAELAAASAIAPETAVELKKVIAMQQNELTQIQSQVSELLKELQNERQRVEEEKARAAASGKANTLQLAIQFPETTAQVKTPQAKKTTKAPETKEAAKAAAEALEVTGTIPVFVVKPDSMQDIAQLTQQVAEQAIAEDAVEEQQAKIPTEMQPKTPQQQVNEAVANIDTLEAEKAKLETEVKLLRKKMFATGMRPPMPTFPMPQNLFQPPQLRAA